MHREESTRVFAAIAAAMVFICTARAADEPRLWVAQGPDLSYGYIDQTGKFIIEPQWVGATPFDGDRASVAQFAGNSFFKKWAIIDRTGKPITPFHFDGPIEFHDGLAKARLLGKSDDPYGFVDRSGNFVIKPRFGGAWEFNYGLAPVFTVGRGNQPNESGFIDKTGKLVIKLPERDIPRPFSRDAIARINIDLDKSQYYIDTKGNRVLTPDKALGESFDFSQGLAVIRLEKKYGYIDRTGKYFVKPVYDDARDFRNGMAAVKVGEKWGFIDGAGKLTVTPMFDAVRDYSEGHAAVNLDGLWYYLNNGPVRTPSVEGYFENAQPFEGGFAQGTRWVDQYRRQMFVFQPGYKHNRNPKGVKIPAWLVQLAKVDEWDERIGPVAATSHGLTEQQKMDITKVGLVGSMGRFDEAVKLNDELVKQKVVEAYVYRGRMYELGHGVKQDLKEAFKWYATAGTHEHPAGLYRAALMARDGKGQDYGKNPVMGGDMLWSAAQKGHAAAYRQLGAIYMEGYLADVDIAKADACLFEAAKRNDGQAIYILSHFHRLGFNGRKPEQADDLVKLAMRHGSRDAYYEHAVKLYEAGEKEQAKTIMSIPAAGGHKAAKAKLKEWAEAQ